MELKFNTGERTLYSTKKNNAQLTKFSLQKTFLI